MYQRLDQKVSFQVLFYIFQFIAAIVFIQQDLFILSPQYITNFKTYLRIWRQFFFWDFYKLSKMRSMSDNQLCSRFRRSSSLRKLIFSSHHSTDFERKIYCSESTIFTQFLKLTLGCGISFSDGAIKNGQKCAGCWTIFFFITHYNYPLFSDFKEICHFTANFFWVQR